MGRPNRFGDGAKGSRPHEDVETLKDFDFLDCAAIALALETDVFFAADLLYEVCRDEAQARGVDAAAFGAALRGRTLFDAVAALTAEYLSFFPDPTTVEKARAARIDAICFGATKALEGAVAAAAFIFRAARKIADNTAFAFLKREGKRSRRRHCNAKTRGRQEG